jgi:acetyl-CoA C-acetyltransferase
MAQAVIASAVRTPIGAFTGALAGVPATELGAIAVAEVARRAAIDPERVDEVLMDAIGRVVERAGVAIGDLDLFELNEAFAAQSIAVCRRLGHPIGASGARVLTTLLHEMARREARLRVAALCIGGGQGIAMLVERPGGALGG